MNVGNVIELMGECSHGLKPGDVLLLLECVDEGWIKGYDIWRVWSPQLGEIELFYRNIHDAKVLI